VSGQSNEPNPWWDPMGVWQQVRGPVVDPGMLDPSAWGARNALQLLVDGLRKALVGRPVTFGTGQGRVAFTLTSLEASVGQLAAATGQADDVSLVAQDAEWRSHHFASVSARLHNVHTRFRERPVLVSAPVDVSLVVSDEVVAALVAMHVPAVSVDVTESGWVRLRHAGRPHWGFVDVRPAAEGGALVVKVVGVGVGSRRWDLGWASPVLRPKVALPEGVRLTGVEVRPSGAEVQLRADEWKLGYGDLVTLGRAEFRSARR
jgi:hypothetical protein